MEEDNTDPYVQRLKKLVRDKAAGKVLQRYVNDELAAVAKEFKANKKAVEDDFGDWRRETCSVRSRCGVLPAKTLLWSNRCVIMFATFTILNTGGKGVVLAPRQPDLAKTIMNATTLSSCTVTNGSRYRGRTGAQRPSTRQKSSW